MPCKDILDLYNMDIDDNYLEILEEIPKSPNCNNRLKWKANPVQHFGTSNKSLLKLKQANQKITQQRDIILELQDKLKHQTGKLDENAKIITNQKKLLKSSRRGKSKLRKDLQLERKRGREILSKLLDFFKHIDNEFSFTIDVLNGKPVGDFNNQKRASFSGTYIIGIESKLKQLSIGVAHKLKKLKNLEANRVTELEKAKQIVGQIQAKSLITTTTTSTQTNTTSTSLVESNYLIPSKSPDLSSIPMNYQAPMRLRLKRTHYAYQEQNDFKTLVDSPTNCKVANVKVCTNNSEIVTSGQTIAANSNYFDSVKRHEEDNKKHEQNLFYCACGLTFGSEKWLNNHINLFDTLWGNEKEGMKGSICGKVN